jgi:hypothetical protein
MVCRALLSRRDARPELMREDAIGDLRDQVRAERAMAGVEGVFHSGPAWGLSWVFLSRLRGQNHIAVPE